MAEWRRLSTAEQFALFLKGEIRDGRWRGAMPGAQRLARDFKINHKFVAGALKILENQKWLISQGVGKNRLISIPSGEEGGASMRVTIFLHDRNNLEWSLIIRLQRLLQSAGYRIHIAPKSLNDLGMDPKRIARFVTRIKTEAWLILAASREVLEWFGAYPVPAFAILGRARNVAIPSTLVDSESCYVKVIRRLVRLGHQRIVLIQREVNRKPRLAAPAQAALDELNALGIPTGPYNVPDWEETPDGLRKCLDGLFSVTPPDALLLTTTVIYHAVRDYLTNRGIRVPKDLSLYCNDADPSSDWFSSTVSHMDWDPDLLLRPVMNWLGSVKRGKPSRRCSVLKPRLVEGETIGPRLGK